MELVELKEVKINGEDRFMDTEEAIGMVCIGREQPLEFDEAHEIVELLRRGEKYKQIVNEYKKYLDKLPTGDNSLKLYKLLNKYFPKEEKE